MALNAWAMQLGAGLSVAALRQEGSGVDDDRRTERVDASLADNEHYIVVPPCRDTGSDFSGVRMQLH